MSESTKLQVIEGAVRPVVVLTPMEMLGRAVESGAGIEVLEKLMALQERYEANQARKAFNEAIADAKTKIKPIIKNRKVDFTSQKGRTNYDYEDLAQIADSIDPILSEHGLSYRHRSRQEGEKLYITCIVSHRGGHSEETELSAQNDKSGNKNDIQAVGSAATFLQRYTLKIALGLSATKDDDGRAAGLGKTISADQLNELVSLADDVEADKQAFCRYLSASYKIDVKSFADIPADKFPQALAALEKKRGK